LLAPQRGLIATGEKQKQLQRHKAREATGFGKNEGNSVAVGRDSGTAARLAKGFSRSLVYTPLLFGLATLIRR
jgi:hypothetical protein